MTLDIDGEMQKAKQEMNDAEDALIQSGFSEDQWMLIKQYVHSVVMHSQLAQAKGWQNLKIDPEEP